MAVNRIVHRSIYSNLDSLDSETRKKSKLKLYRIFFMLNPEKATRKRITNRLHALSHKQETSIYHKQHNAEIKLEILTYYSKTSFPSCVCCGINVIDTLSLDHINRGGAQHRLESGNVYSEIRRHHNKHKSYPEGYQTMCFNCNWVKHLRGVCNINHNAQYVQLGVI